MFLFCAEHRSELKAEGHLTTLVPRLGLPLGRFLRWWEQELGGMVPVARWSAGRKQSRIVVSVSQGSSSWYEEKAQTRRAIYQGDQFDAPAGFLVGRSRDPIRLRLNKSDCFERLLHLPRQASDEFPEIIQLDLERSTPFSLSDVYHDFTVASRENPSCELLTVRHLIVKRSIVDELRKQFSDRGIQISEADCWDDDGVTPISINFLKPTSSKTSRRPSLLNRAMAVAILALAAAALFLEENRTSTALTSLDSEIEKVKSELQSIRTRSASVDASTAGLAALNRFLNSSSQPSSILAELTRVMPDDSYLTEIRFDSSTVNFAGYATKAAPLIPLLAGSRLFGSVEMTAPVTLDGVANKEQFRIEAKLPVEAPGAPGSPEQH